MSLCDSDSELILISDFDDSVEAESILFPDSTDGLSTTPH